MFRISADSRSRDWDWVLGIGRPFVLLFSARRLVAGAAQACFEIILQPVAEENRCGGYDRKSLFWLPL